MCCVKHWRYKVLTKRDQILTHLVNKLWKDFIHYRLDAFPISTTKDYMPLSSITALALTVLNREDYFYFHF